jgi:acyl carrier protein
MSNNRARHGNSPGTCPALWVQPALRNHHAATSFAALEVEADLVNNDSTIRHGSSAMLNSQTDCIDSSSGEYLLQLWSMQLNRPEIGVRDDFFEAGGSSMQVIEMLMTVSNKFGKEIDYAEFFKEPCIQKLTELLGG